MVLHAPSRIKPEEAKIGGRTVVSEDNPSDYQPTVHWQFPKKSLFHGDVISVGQLTLMQSADQDLTLT